MRSLAGLLWRQRAACQISRRRMKRNIATTTTSSTGNMNNEMAAPCATSPELMPVWKPAKPRTEVAPTGPHEKDNGKIGKGKHDAEDEADGHNRQNHRHDNLVVAPPETGAVDSRRVEHVL